MILRKSRYAAFAALVAATGFCLPATGRAQTNAPAAEAQAENPPPSAGKISLKDVLLKVRLQNVGLALAVGAENVTRDKKEIDGKDVRRINPAVEAFGMKTHPFGSVLAIGPQTYTELTTDFRDKNIFADMPPSQAFTLLLAGLDARQRNVLTSKEGLGIGDLTTPEQKQLFTALLPDQDASVIDQAGIKYDEDNPLGIGNPRDRINSIHFRIAQNMRILYKTIEQEDYNTGSLFSPPDVDRSSVYSLYYKNDFSKVNGVVVRKEVFNHPKLSDLNYASPFLQTEISIKNLNTVGDLIARIVKQTKIEIYTDIHYENEPLLWIANGSDSESAGELLRAVAFCLPATYRRVGKAFALTESIEGVGKSRQIIQDFEEECNAERKKTITEAEKSIKETLAQKKLKINTFNSLQTTPEQEKASQLTQNDGWFVETKLPFNQLTQKQQQALQDYSDKQIGGWKANFDEKFTLQGTLEAQMMLPDLKGFIKTGFGAGMLPLFRPEPLLLHPTEDEWKAFLSAYQNLPKWTEAAKTYDCRAVICRPHSRADVDASLVRIKAMGFNQMWMVVFENGKAAIPGTPFPLDPACDPKTDLLTYAISEGNKQGVTICPVVNVYSWGADAPKDLRLLTLRGEDSKESAMRRAKINRLTPPALSIDQIGSSKIFLKADIKTAPPSSVVIVDPTNSTVQSFLLGLFKTVAAHTGAGSWVCRAWNRDIVIGFSGWRSSTYDFMGYNVGLREAFLQKSHRDPIDLSPESMTYNSDTRRADTSLTNYDDREQSGLLPEWFKFRNEALSKAFHALFDSALRDCGDRKPKILLAQEQGESWRSRFDVWSGSPAPFPEVDAINPSPEQKSSVYFLPKEPEGIRPLLPKELQKVDWRDLQMRTLEMLKPYRKWEGIVIEE